MYVCDGRCCWEHPDQHSLPCVPVRGAGDLRGVALLGLPRAMALCQLPGFLRRFRLTHTWRTPCAKSAALSLALSSAETR